MSILNRHLTALRRVGDGVLARRCRLGMRRLRRNTAMQAVSAMSAAIKQRRPMAALRHLGSALKVSPSATTFQIAHSAFDWFGKSMNPPAKAAK